jgi:hypothetical protein
VSALLFAICFGEGYPTLNHYNPRRFPGSSTKRIPRDRCFAASGATEMIRAMSVLPADDGSLARGGDLRGNGKGDLVIKDGTVLL